MKNIKVCGDKDIYVPECHGTSCDLGKKTVTANGTYDADDDALDGYSSVTVNVPSDITPEDEGKVVRNGSLVSQTARYVSSNGTYDTTTNDSTEVDVPNTYTAGDEGKVVDNGALVSQTSLSVSSNGTYATTLNDTVIVNVGGQTMTILSYGNSTWAEFIAAYQTNSIVYCRASSNANPATGSQTRLAFMAYVSDATNPTSVEFQYYRSVNTHSASQQGDQVYVYKLTNNNTWTVTVRENYTEIVAGTGLSSTYNSGTLTLNNSSLGLLTSEYNSTNTYNLHDFVLHNGSLYECNADNITGAWNSTYWSQKTVGEVLTTLRIDSDLNMWIATRAAENIAPWYDDTLTYAVDDFVMYLDLNGGHNVYANSMFLCKCIVDVTTPEPFDPDKWQIMTIGEVLTDILLQL